MLFSISLISTGRESREGGVGGVHIPPRLTRETRTRMVRRCNSQSVDAVVGKGNSRYSGALTSGILFPLKSGSFTFSLIVMSKEQRLIESFFFCCTELNQVLSVKQNPETTLKHTAARGERKTKRRSCSASMCLYKTCWRSCHSEAD